MNSDQRAYISESGAVCRRIGHSNRLLFDPAPLPEGGKKKGQFQQAQAPCGHI